MNTIQDVLHFWFGESPGARRKAWFEKDPALDADVRARFLRLHASAASGALSAWNETQNGSLALIVLTDQLPRNMLRGTAEAFATDSIALACAGHLIACGWDAHLLPVERMFVYLPFEHSESLADQQRSIDLFAPLAKFAETADTAEYARRHWEIVRRFGRFPHRNAALGRGSTPEELEFLATPGSAF